MKRWGGSGVAGKIGTEAVTTTSLRDAWPVLIALVETWPALVLREAEARAAWLAWLRYVRTREPSAPVLWSLVQMEPDHLTLTLDRTSWRKVQTEYRRPYHAEANGARTLYFSGGRRITIQPAPTDDWKQMTFAALGACETGTIATGRYRGDTLSLGNGRHVKDVDEQLRDLEDGDEAEYRPLTVEQE